MLNFVRHLAFITAVLSSALASAEDGDTGYAQEQARAKALLGKAVEYYKEHGDEALPVFSRQGEFVDDQLYVYVVSTDGVMLASGGPSVILVGRKVESVLSDDLRKAFTEALTTPEGQMHDAQYRWLNRNDGKVEQKHTYFQRQGDRVLAVGYYLPRANPAQAKTLLTSAADAVAQDPQSTFEAVNNLDKRFFQDDLYVFAVSLKTKRFVAHGYNQRLVGTDFKSLKSADNKPIGQNMLDAISSKGEGEFAYLWRNPVTGRNEHKHSYLKKVGDYLVAVGYYSR